MNARYGVPSHNPQGLQRGSRLFGVLAASSTVNGSATVSLTYGVSSAGTPAAFAAATAAFTFGVSSSGTATGGQSPTPPGYHRGVPVAERAARHLTSRAYFPKPSLAGSATEALTFSAASSGTPTAFAAATATYAFGAVSSGTPAAFASDAAAHTFGVSSSGTPTAFAAATAAYAFGAAASGSVSGAAASIPGAVRAIEAHNPPKRTPVSTVYSALTTHAAGSATMSLTFGAVSAGTAPGTTLGLGIAQAAGTNQGRVGRAAPRPTKPTVDRGSRPFFFLPSTPPIYRVVVQGGTNQGFTFQAVKQPAPVKVNAPAVYTGHAPSGAGAATVTLTFGVSSAGTATAVGSATAGYVFGGSVSGATSAFAAATMALLYGFSSAGLAALDLSPMVCGTLAPAGTTQGTLSPAAAAQGALAPAATPQDTLAPDAMTCDPLNPTGA